MAQDKINFYTQEFIVEGMHCAACELLIEKKLANFTGVTDVNAKLNEGKVYIRAADELNSKELSKLVEPHGYRIVDGSAATKPTTNFRELGVAALIAMIVFGSFLLLQKLGIVNLIGEGEITLPAVFLIGIVASLSTCMGVVGGLVLSISSNFAQHGRTLPLVMFHASRLIGFFVLGGIMGLIGAAFILTPTVSFVMSILVALVMLVMGLNMLDIFPQARKLQLKLPKRLGKTVVNLENSTNIFVPVLLGVATFILPCGFTQSMQLHALSSANFLNSALIMLVFALGTLPVLASLSFVSVKFSHTKYAGLFFKTAGMIVILFAIFNVFTAFAGVGMLPALNL